MYVEGGSVSDHRVLGVVLWVGPCQTVEGGVLGVML